MDLAKQIEDIRIANRLEIRGRTYQEQIKDTLTELLADLFAHHTVAIKGGGTHTAKLLELIRATGNLEKVYGIYDRKYTQIGEVKIGDAVFTGYPDSELVNCEADVVIASTFAHRREAAREIRQFNEDLTVFDLYDEMENKGIIINFLFYRAVEKGYESLLYYRSVYLANRDADSLWNYLVACIMIDDFLSFREYVEIYIENRWDGYESLQTALQNFADLFEQVKDCLRKRKQKDMIMLWVDQLEYGQLQWCPFIQKQAEGSLFLENAYTFTPFTVATLYSIFLNLRSLDDKFYIDKPDVFSVDNSRFLSVVEKNGYDFTYIGDSIDAALFREEDRIGNYAYGPSTIRCVQMLQKLMDSEKPAFILLHELVETHTPYLGGSLDRARMIAWPYFLGVSDEERMEQMRKSALYWDRQWEWYSSFLNDEMSVIYMSDHGKRHDITPIYKEKSTHVLVFAKGPGIPDKRIRKLFSLIDFYKLVEALLGGHYEEEAFCSDHVQLQESAIFNDTTIKFYLENHAENSAKAFRAVRTLTELFAKLSTGERFYYLLPDEETDHANDPAYAERIEELDALAGDVFWNFDGYEERLKFFRSRMEGHE
ncbi:MAG: hypothetical protein K6D90_03760 [Lachnospiraceae bacterium]|nr:hypothetical protein [Lachnospiraceae bacterium]